MVTNSYELPQRPGVSLAPCGPLAIINITEEGQAPPEAKAYPGYAGVNPPVARPLAENPSRPRTRGGEPLSPGFRFGIPLQTPDTRG